MSGPWDQYCGPPPFPAELLGRWNFEPFLMGTLFVVAVGHLLLLQRCREWMHKRCWFAATWLLMGLLFVSPLCALSSALFSARIAHHVVLIAVVSPFAVLALPARWRAARISAGALSTILTVHTIVVWSWHAPSLYAFALLHHTVFWAMQLSLLGTALLLWFAVLSQRMQLFSSATALLATTLQMGLLGAIITFAPRPLYAPHFGTTDPFGLTALDDQQIGGLIMWVPAVLPYLIAALILLGRQVTHGGAAARVP